MSIILTSQKQEISNGGSSFYEKHKISYIKNFDKFAEGLTEIIGL